MGKNVIFRNGVKEQFDLLEQKESNALYWLQDVQELYKGDTLFGTGAVATQKSPGLMSPTDKKRLDELVAGTVSGLTAVDASILVADGEDGGKTIGVQISKEAGNTITLKDDGLFANGTGISNASYTVEKQENPADGYAATYRLKQTVDGETSFVGDAINIPKDQFIQSGSVKTVSEVDQPYAGAAIGDIYIELVLNDPEASCIYIPANGLIDQDAYVIGNVDDSDNGTSKIFNEASGGGAMYIANDGTQAFVGVNNGELDGMMAQIYADKQVDGQWLGSRINVYHDKIYYTSLAEKTAGKANNDDACEIATKGDVAGVQSAVDLLSESLVWGSL